MSIPYANRGSWTHNGDRGRSHTPCPTHNQTQHTNGHMGVSVMTQTETVEAAREEMELEHLVEVLGDDSAQAAAERHALPRLVHEVQH